jgi:hypothetical protein
MFVSSHGYENYWELAVQISACSDGEKSSPTAAHAGHKRWLQWVVPSALGYSWTDFTLGGYK